MRCLMSKVDPYEMIPIPVTVKMCRKAPDFCRTMLKNRRNVVSGSDNLINLIKLLVHFKLWVFLIELNVLIKHVDVDFPVPLIFL